MSHTPEESVIASHPLTWIEIDAGALRHNLALFGLMLEGHDLGHRVMPVVKSNAYGHGLAPIVRLLASDGIGWFGVNSLDEAREVRALAREARILVMGYVDPARFDEALAAGLDLTLTNPEEIPVLDRAAAAVGVRARLHVKVETGTHRRGLVEVDYPALGEIARTTRYVEWVGLSTHFANIEDTINHDYAERQIARFQEAVSALAELGVHFPMRHVACTAAALLFPETHLDIARVGIGLYGLWPSRETRLSYRSAGHPQELAELRPVLTWKARLTQVKRVPAGAFIGYGCTYKTATESVIGVLPVGYFEGYDRGLSNAAHVLVRGRRAPVRGRVCMNMTLVDLTHVPGAAVGDEVVMIGSMGDEAVTADDLGTWSGTINYEIVSRIHPAIPRLAGPSASSGPRVATGL